MTQPTYDLLNYRFYEDDGTGEDDQTALGTGNNETLVRGTGTANRFCVRVELHNDNAKSGVESWSWEYNYDGGGWTTLDGASVIGLYDSSLLTDGEDCTQRLTSSTPFLTANAGVDETGGIPSVSVGASDYLENLLSCYIIDADVADAKTILIRIIEDSSDVITYSNTPTITTSKAVSVYKDLQAKWDMRELVSKDLQAEWALFELIGKSTQAVWDIFSSVYKDVQAKWDIRELVSKDLQAIWDIRELVYKDLQAVWDILSLAVQVSKDLQAKYDILNLVFKNVQAKWDILNSVYKDVQAKWDVFNLVNKSIEAKWDILNLVNKSIEAVWDMRMLVAKSIQAKWDILNGAPPDDGGGKRGLGKTSFRWTSRMGG